jgi:tRNA/rRNA methyltransferase
MLLPEELDRVCVVLVRARNPSNIGAVARAMHDFGVPHLRIVNDFPVPFEAARSAVDASAVLACAIAFPTLAEAVADCTLVVGTTAVGERDLQHPLLTLAEAAPRILTEIRTTHHPADTEPNSSRIALLFGSEKTGLSNDELSHCHWLLTIPMHQRPDTRHPSMNLGQAVAVCLYELVRKPPALQVRASAIAPAVAAPARENLEPSPTTALHRPPAAELERLTILLSEVLDATGYRRHHPANSDAEHLRRLVLRMSAEASDTSVWLGILRQVLWKLRHTATQELPQ